MLFTELTLNLAESSHERVATISDFLVKFTNTLSPKLAGGLCNVSASGGSSVDCKLGLK